MKKDIFFSIIFVIAIVLTRTISHLGANIEFVTAFAIGSTLVFKQKNLSILIVMLGLIISDLIIGNTIIFLFTWSGFLAPIALARLMSRYNFKFIEKLGLTQMLAIGSTLIFFLWTNLGVVLTTTMYTKDLGGLLASYINGLPFLRTQLVANLLIVPAVFVVSFFIYNLQYKALDLRLENEARKAMI